MILLFLASLAAQPAAACPDTLTEAALVCRAIDASKAGDHSGAAKAFEALAEASKSEVERAKAYAAAGNLWLAADQPGKAALALDRALVGTALQADQRGNALLDRARVAESQNDLRSARGYVDRAAAIISDDPFLWYFSAALAIREENKVRAQSAINRALSLAPADPSVQFEAGHVAQFVGDAAKARQHWQEAQRLDPEGAIGKAAKEALTLLPARTSISTEAKVR
jgi:tetratricopeptide (TPR) repeat protein